MPPLIREPLCNNLPVAGSKGKAEIFGDAGAADRHLLINDRVAADGE